MSHHGISVKRESKMTNVTERIDTWLKWMWHLNIIDTIYREIVKLITTKRRWRERWEWCGCGSSSWCCRLFAKWCQKLLQPWHLASKNKTLAHRIKATFLLDCYHTVCIRTLN